MERLSSVVGDGCSICHAPRLMWHDGDSYFHLDLYTRLRWFNFNLGFQQQLQGVSKYCTVLLVRSIVLVFYFLHFFPYIYKFYYIQDAISRQSTTEKFNKSTIYIDPLKINNQNLGQIYNLSRELLILCPTDWCYITTNTVVGMKSFDWFSEVFTEFGEVLLLT